jgi:A/G-specific adenine glycosylase
MRNDYHILQACNSSLEVIHKLNFGNLTQSTIDIFQELIYNFYRKQGRLFSWRTTSNPYHILVSEIMLQQTQVNRVIPKYEEFVHKFPDFYSLNNASLKTVMNVWKGLGYNRRAVHLKNIAYRVLSEFNGVLPNNVSDFTSFPGIGNYTASAICTFAFNQPHVFIETNIRTVFIHFFFSAEKNNIKDSVLMPLIKQTLDISNPKEWYYALMDYGAMIKKIMINPSRRSAEYQKQPLFKKSNREIRGKILSTLLQKPKASIEELSYILNIPIARLTPLVYQLLKEKIIAKEGETFLIP